MVLHRLTLRSKLPTVRKHAFSATSYCSLLWWIRAGPGVWFWSRMNRSMQFWLVLAIFAYCQFSGCSSWRCKSRTLGPSAVLSPTGEQHGSELFINKCERPWDRQKQTKKQLQLIYCVSCLNYISCLSHISKTHYVSKHIKCCIVAASD